MEFNIRDKVRDKATDEICFITDKMYSEAKNRYIYDIEAEDGSFSCMRTADEIEAFRTLVDYQIETQIADNVVIGIIYEVENGEKYEVCRGHGHIIHEGAEGIAQACAYAYKQAFISIDSGIYMKQRRGIIDANRLD